MFTNVRLVPCFVSASVQQSASAATGIVSKIEAGGTAVESFGAAAFGSIQDGFERTIGRPTAKAGDALTDSRLLVQIGMLLGMVYLAFLTVWFWATRLRWNPRV
jgi:hypothetical protein